MKITFNTVELLKVLREMVKITPSNSTQPAFKSVLIKADKENEKVEIVASNGNLTLRQALVELLLNAPVTIQESGTVLLPGRELLEIAKRAGEQISIESKTPTRVTVFLAKTKYELQGIDPSAFHPFVNNDEKVSTKMPVTALRRLVERTSYATATNETRPILQGVNIVITETGTVARATDGLRLAKAEVSVTADENLDITVRSEALEMLASFLPDDNDDGEGVYLEIGGTSLVAIWNDGDSEFSMLGLDGKFPNVEQIVPKSFKETFHVNRQELQNALSRVAIVALTNPRDQAYAEITISSGQMKLYAKSTACGFVQDFVVVEGEPTDEITFGANVKYLLDVMEAMPADDVELGFNAPNMPFVFSCEETIGLVSPILLKPSVKEDTKEKKSA